MTAQDPTVQLLSKQVRPCSNYPNCLHLSPLFRRLKTPMKNLIRHFSCHFCHKKAVICHVCDRGNTYCSIECSQSARRVLKRAYDRKYQNNQKGRLKHAERQKRYRLKCAKIVTDHSSKPLPTHGLLKPTTSTDHQENRMISSNDRCHFCGNIIDNRAFDGIHK